MPAILSELHYLPSIPYSQQLLKADELLLDTYEHYPGQTYRNHALAVTTQGLQPLTGPVVDGARSEKICTSEIDYRACYASYKGRFPARSD